MNDYQQPDFYRFNEDSLKLVKWVLSRVSCAGHILDLGAGSGVIGIELSMLLKPRYLTFVELQNEYEFSLNENIRLFVPQETKVETVFTSFKEWRPEISYDLIVCNPPYYLAGHGQRSKDPRRDQARSFLVDDWRILLKSIGESLAEKGKAFLVIKNDKKILNEISSNSEKLSFHLYDQGKLMFVELMRLDKDGDKQSL